MPILGGNRPHEWSDQGDIDKLQTDSTHKGYKLSEDIAGQLGSDHVYRESCELDETYYDKRLNKNFLKSFVDKFSKWLSREDVEAG